MQILSCTLEAEPELNAKSSRHMFPVWLAFDRKEAIPLDCEAYDTI